MPHMSTIPITTVEQDHWSEKQIAYVEHRGCGFGKIVLYTPDETEQPEMVFLWSNGGRVCLQGTVGNPTREQKNRAVRALAETTFGRVALSLDDDFDWQALPDYVPEPEPEPVEEPVATVVPEPVKQNPTRKGWRRLIPGNIQVNIHVHQDG